MVKLFENNGDLDQMPHSVMSALGLLCLQSCQVQGKKVWKMKSFPGQGKGREVWFESGKLPKNGKSQGKVRKFQNFLKTEMAMTVF